RQSTLRVRPVADRLRRVRQGLRPRWLSLRNARRDPARRASAAAPPARRPARSGGRSQREADAARGVSRLAAALQAAPAAPLVYSASFEPRETSMSQPADAPTRYPRTEFPANREG